MWVTLVLTLYVFMVNFIGMNIGRKAPGNRKESFLENLLSRKMLFSGDESVKRGARVCGMSLCPEVHSFIEDASPEISAQRLVSMAFGSNVQAIPVSVPFDFDIEDFENEEDE